MKWLRVLPLPWACALMAGPEEPPVNASHHLTERAAHRARERLTRRYNRQLQVMGWWFEVRPRRDRRSMFQWLDDEFRELVP